MATKYLLSFLIMCSAFASKDVLASECHYSFSNDSIIRNTRLILKKPNLSFEDYNQIAQSAENIVSSRPSTQMKEKGLYLIKMALENEENLPEGVVQRMIQAMEKIEQIYQKNRRGITV